MTVKYVLNRRPAADKLAEVETTLSLLQDAVGALCRPVIYGLDPGLPAGRLACSLLLRMGQRRFRVLQTKMAALDRGLRLEACARRHASGKAKPAAVIDLPEAAD
jgi:hypothetical protein